MTARREARRGQLLVEVAGYDVPPELLDPDHAVWQTSDGAQVFADSIGLPYWPCAGDRLRPLGKGVTHPHNRRNHALEAWACVNGITDDRNSVDRHRLRAMGLYGTPHRKDT